MVETEEDVDPLSLATEDVQAAAQAVTNAPERVLIVEDDGAARVGLEQLVRNWGFLAESAADGEEALEKVTSFRPAIVISDLVMPRLDGLGLLRALQAQSADVTTLLLTAQGTVETAVEAMKEGAYDYLTKPVDIQRLKILLDKIVERQETLREVKTLRRQLREHGAFGPMIGNSPEMRKIYQVVEQAAPTSASVLITGESGTGASARAPASPSSPSTARPFPRHCSRARSSGTRRARSQAPRTAGKAASSSRTAAPCSSTRSER
jgi:DNA-binding NtrC family response regulator